MKALLYRLFYATLVFSKRAPVSRATFLTTETGAPITTETGEVITIT